jgi:hypothetical protein
MTPLCTRADIEAVYMATNITKWADLNGTGVLVDIAARITHYCELATADFYGRMLGGCYETPISFQDDTASMLVTHHVASFAGVLLYEANGVIDFNPETGDPQHRLHFQRKQYETFCTDLLSGKRRINATRISHGSTSPTVVR